MKALVKQELGFGNLELQHVEEPAAASDHVKILVKYSGICGSDIHTYEGHYKVAAPVTLGHEFAGEVVEIGENVHDIQVGDRVTSETTFYICGECRYCRTKDYNLCSSRKGLGTQKNGAFGKYVIARSESVHKLPENVDYAAAAFTEPLACCYHGVEKSSIKKGDVVVVLGPGPIGLLTAQIAKDHGAEVMITGLSKDKTRLDKADELGIDHVVNIEDQDIKELVNKLSDGYGADIVYECSGAVPALKMGLDLLAKKGEYVQIGIFPEPDVVTDFEKIIQKELNVSGSRSQKSSDWEPSLQLMNEGRIDTAALVTHEYTIEEWEKAYEAIKEGDAIKVLLTPVE